MDAGYIASLKKVLSDSSPKRKRNSLGVKTGSRGKKKKTLPSNKSSHLKRPQLKEDSLESEIQSSMFRFLNEKLYTCSSSDAVQYFSENPGAFELYHKGFQRQLRKWPNDPLQWPEQIIRKEFKKSPIVADLGCGDARLAQHLKGLAKVHSFDLVAVNDRVTVCDMSKTPLPKESVDIVVLCLALMGTNCRDFVFEANRTNVMDAIIGHVREGNLADTRIWLENTENDVNQGDEHRFGLLHWAAREGQLAVADLLISRGARVNATNLGDDTPLHLAAAHGHFDVVQYLLANYRLAVDAANEHGNTPLHYACFWNYQDIAELLIKHGASLVQENKYGATPLEIARPFTAKLLGPLAQTLGQDLSRRRPFRDSSWIGTKTRARDATIYKLDGDAWDPRDVELTGALADGHGAEVLRGFFQRNEVVVKMLKLPHYTVRQARDFKEEFPRLRIFNHPNILPVLAIFNATPRLCLISEFMPHGSLFSLLHPPQSQHQQDPGEGETRAQPFVSLKQCFRFALDIAKAMEFLHSPELKVPNFRLNSKHVLVDEDIAKIGCPSGVQVVDGVPVATPDDEEETLTARLDMADYKFSFHEKAREYNPAWMSPEALQKKPGDINLQASDMWSFGVILWELMTRLEPFGGVEPMVIGMQVAAEGLRLPRFPDMDSRIVRLLDLCMNEDPGKRPRFDMLLPLLDKMRERAGQRAQ
ncbi:hypothetical protein SprV_0200567500 [Sparganum proliferum]